jgi:hypothetical protein
VMAATCPGVIVRLIPSVTLCESRDSERWQVARFDILGSPFNDRTSVPACEN